MRLDSTPQSRLRDESDAGFGFGGITSPDTARPPAGHMLNWLPLGLTRLNQRRNEAAKSELETALRLNPNNYLAHGSLGLLYMGQGELAAAETHLQSAVRLNPNDLTAQENLKRVQAANAKAQR